VPHRTEQCTYVVVVRRLKSRGRLSPSVNDDQRLRQYARPHIGGPMIDPADHRIPQEEPECCDSTTLIGPPSAAAIDHFLDAIPGHVLIIDAKEPGERIVFANRAALRDYDYVAIELVGRSFTSLLESNSDAGAVVTLIDQAVREGKITRAELTVARRDGSTFIAGVTFAPVVCKGETTHVICSARDITSIVTEQRRSQELQDQLLREMRERERIAIELRLAQRLEAVGRLAAGIAHEINTPIQFVGDSVYFLQSAFGDLQQLVTFQRRAIDELASGGLAADVLARLAQVESSISKDFIDAEIPAAFERTREGIGRVASIVSAMREFAHPHAKDPTPADINHAIETTLLVARNEYKYTATVLTELGDLPLVTCNVDELNQVFLNLIVNAAHAIEASGRDPGSGLIRIVSTVVEDCVEIAFEDNGCGIAAENLERIFDPFFTTKDVGKGTGQGLAIARSIVERHGGTISVSSEVNCGTRMALRLPIAAGPRSGIR